MEPLVQVLLPTYNRPQYFELALESVLSQTYSNYTILISDDSTDTKTKELVQKKYQKHPKIHYVHNPGFSLNDNFNYLKEHISPNAKYVNYLMDDDLFYPTKLAEMVAFLEEYPDALLCTSPRDLIDAEDKVTDQQKPLNPEPVLVDGIELGKLILFSGDNYIGEPTTPLIRATILNQPYFGRQEGASEYLIQDILRWFAILSQGKIIMLPKPLSAFRAHSANGSLENDTPFLLRIVWATIIKAAWEQKVFLTTEQDLKEALYTWLYHSNAVETRAILHKTNSQYLDRFKALTSYIYTDLQGGLKLDFNSILYPAK